MADNYLAIKLTSPTAGVFGDGAFTGALGHNGGTVPPGSVTGYNTDINFWAIPPITPAVGERHPARTVGKRIVYVNGIGTSRQAHADTVKLLSVVSGASVVGIYNQSGDGGGSGFLDYVADLVQCLGDKSGLSNNPATHTMAKAIYDACVSGVHLNVVAHSQGAIITSRAARQAIGMLLDRYGRMDHTIRPLIENVERRRGFFESVGRGLIGANDVDRVLLGVALRRLQPSIEERLHDFVSIQTFGGAARFYPNGPLYRHVVNFWDPVPNLFGQGDIITGPGRGARVETIDRNTGLPIRDFDDHSMDGVYLQSSEYFVDRNGRRVDSNYVPIDMTMVRTN